jgi:glycosyltransferase involved in cell wall biosynthesis
VPDEAALAEAEKIWSCPPGKRILTVGSFKDQKNHQLLLRSFSQMISAEARLMLVGTGQSEVNLRALAADLGIADRVIFAGFHPDPTPFYMTADLFVLSSDYEGFGNVIVEAMACGTPVVSTDCPSGPAEILENGRYGRLVPVNNPSALATAMRVALAETPDRAMLQKRAAEFSSAIAAQRYLDLLEIS